MILKFGTKATEVDFYGVPVGIDASTFFTAIPLEVKAAIPLMTEDISDKTSIITQQICHILTKDRSDEQGDQAYLKLLEQMNIEPSDFGLIYTSLYTIISTIMKKKVMLNTACDDLKKMNVPLRIIDHIRSSLTPAIRMDAESAIKHNKTFVPRLSHLKWRVDVIISSNELAKVLRPRILMQLLLNNGQSLIFEVSIEQFNQLRYDVAKVLHSMKTLERHPIIKIVNEFERRDEELRMK